MIVLPKRSVTRFFIPLIDVMILLFCIFLLMPMVKGPDEEGPAADYAREERLRQLEEEIARLKRDGAEEPKALQEELQRLRQERLKALQERLRIRVLEIDANTGKLYYNDAGRVEVTQAKARELIAQDRIDLAGGRAEVYYLILFPRDPNSPFPLRYQREDYERWFGDVPHGWDVPGSGPARGGPPPGGGAR
jgi:hypothetical protein